MKTVIHGQSLLYSKHRVSKPVTNDPNEVIASI